MNDWRTRLKLAMTRAGRTQTDVARACGIKPPSVNAWFGKTGMPGAEKMVAAAQFLGTTVEWLFSGKPDPLTPAAPSHAMRLDTDTVKDALRFLALYAEATDTLPPGRLDAAQFAAAYEIVAAAAESPSENNVLEFKRRYDAKLREQEKSNAAVGSTTAESGEGRPAQPVDTDEPPTRRHVGA